MARKRKSKPTSAKRSRTQKVKDRYAHAREDAQLLGLIPTAPEEALKPERVPPSVQGEQQIPSLDRQAIRNGWEVPDDVKKKVVDRLAEPFFEDSRKVLTKDGKELTLPPDRNLLKENAKVLILADQRQYERDEPERAGKARGGGNTTNVEANVAVVIDPLALYRAALEQADDDEKRLPAGPGGTGEDVVAGGDVLRQAAADHPQRPDE